MVGAELLVSAMKMSGIETLFSLSGNQIMPIYDACLEPGIRIVHTRHESAAVSMADAYAQLTDAPAVALVTAAPGFANALGGLYSALMAESPVVFISGDSPVSLDGKRAFQEFPQLEVSSAFVKYSERVEKPEELAAAWYRCFHAAASGRPGPVHLSVPVDVLCAETSARADDKLSLEAHTAVCEIYSRLEPTEDDIQSLLETLGSAKTPLILTGPAMSESRLPELMESLQETLQVPVLCLESPRGLADPSLGKLKEVIRQADCIILFGKLPDFTLAFGNPYDIPANVLLLIEPDPEEFEKSLKILDGRERIVINSLLRELAHLLVMANPTMPERPAWQATVDDLLAADPIQPEAVVRDAESTVKLLPATVCSEVQTSVEAESDSIVVCDGGEFGQWAQAYTRGDARIINGPSGAIGSCLAYAIGAKVARPDATVFVLCGDGTVGFYLGELETAVRELTPFILIVGNDSCWNAEHQIQIREYGAERTHSCRLGTDVRYDLAAIGLGARGEFVSSAEQLQEALSTATKAAREQGLSTCINVSMRGLSAPVFE